LSLSFYLLLKIGNLGLILVEGWSCCSFKECWYISWAYSNKLLSKVQDIASNIILNYWSQQLCPSLNDTNRNKENLNYCLKIQTEPDHFFVGGKDEKKSIQKHALVCQKKCLKIDICVESISINFMVVIVILLLFSIKWNSSSKNISIERNFSFSHFITHTRVYSLKSLKYHKKVFLISIASSCS